MYHLKLELAAVKALVLEVLGTNQKTPRTTTQQRKAEAHHDEIVSLPATYMPPIQNLDPTSDDFGKTYFMPGFDLPGDPNHPPAP